MKIINKLKFKPRVEEISTDLDMVEIFEAFKDLPLQFFSRQ